MSLPTIPDITPEISLDCCKTINLLLSSIAMEEIGLSHILNAEAEKLQTFLKKYPCNFHGYLKINESVNKTLRTVVKSQILLQFKLEDVMELSQQSHCHHPPKPHKCCEDKKDCKDDDPFDSSLCYCPNKKKKDCQCPKCRAKEKI
ncbi:hypothetical protein ACFPN4_13395 [Ureibacillus thermophilus]|uniref:Uncharacterized protein n=1 Tax=Ureibacillus thermophilus TaxID=367743 RepID=A0A4P6UQY8_9BACL|nr:hypothetical protein [Ureibacillus thermophilus]QBK24451.1 hypothetical protein DKZ56_00055 [Ureibacillus thermophilus]